jgi:hypothetical protein
MYIVGAVGSFVADAEAIKRSSLVATMSEQTSQKSAGLNDSET